MLCCAVLCCAVLCCAVLCCAVLCCTVLYCTVLYCTVLYCIELYCTVLVLYRTRAVPIPVLVPVPVPVPVPSRRTVLLYCTVPHQSIPIGVMLGSTNTGPDGWRPRSQPHPRLNSRGSVRALMIFIGIPSNTVVLGVPRKGFRAPLNGVAPKLCAYCMGSSS